MKKYPINLIPLPNGDIGIKYLEETPTVLEGQPLPKSRIAYDREGNYFEVIE